VISWQSPEKAVVATIRLVLFRSGKDSADAPEQHRGFRGPMKRLRGARSLGVAVGFAGILVIAATVLTLEAKVHRRGPELF
jgi:hypothetical protein